jgi:hypothetical protein
MPRLCCDSNSSPVSSLPERVHQVMCQWGSSFNDLYPEQDADGLHLNKCDVNDTLFLLALSVESKGKCLLMRHTQVSFLKFVIMY